jgi:ABC-type branched-subunit amino acid transport system substrate-binding protein
MLRRVVISFFMLSLIACATKKVSGPQVVKAIDKPAEIKAEPTKKDTVVAEVKPVIKTSPKVESPKKSNVSDKRSVAIILPFKTDMNYISESENLRFLQYYGGMKLAAKRLEGEGLYLDLKVFDSEDFTLSKLSGAKLDAIIGPYASASSEASKSLLQSVANYGKENQILVVSPFYSNSKAANNNPYYLQIKPNIREHFVKMISHISENYSSKEVTFVLRNNQVDDRWNDYLQSLSKIYFKEASQISVVRLSDDVSPGGLSAAVTQGKKVFVFPNYSFSDETYLQKALSRLSSEKSDKTVYVYGMPLMLESDKIGVSTYSSLNTRIVVPEHLDREDEAVNEVTRSYFELFKTIPAAEAFEGYDLMLYIGRSLSRFGNDFVKSTAISDEEYLQTGYKILPVYEDGDDTFKNPSFYENKHLFVIGYSGGKLRKL